MTVKKLVVLFLSMILIAVFSTGCGSNASSSSKSTGSSGSSGSSSKTYKIAYLTPTMNNPYWRDLAQGIKSAAQKQSQKITVQVYSSNESSSDQLKNAQDAIAKHVDAIVLSPLDSSTAPAVLNLAKQANIPVVIADVGTDSGTYASFVISNNYDGAYKVGEYLAKYLKQKGFSGATASQITISLARTNGKQRTKGFKDAMEKNGFKVSGLKQMKSYTEAESEGFAQDLMTSNPELHAIFSQTAEPTLGVVKAVQDANKAGQVAVVGFDAIPQTIQDVKDGKIVADAVQQPFLYGKAAMEQVMNVLTGKKVTKKVVIPIVVVTKENVDKEGPILQKTAFPSENK